MRVQDVAEVMRRNGPSSISEKSLRDIFQAGKKLLLKGGGVKAATFQAFFILLGKFY